MKLDAMHRMSQEMDRMDQASRQHAQRMPHHDSGRQKMEWYDYPRKYVFRPVGQGVIDGAEGTRKYVLRPIGLGVIAGAEGTAEGAEYMFGDEYGATAAWFTGAAKTTDKGWNDFIDGADDGWYHETKSDTWVPKINNWLSN